MDLTTLLIHGFKPCVLSSEVVYCSKCHYHVPFEAIPGLIYQSSACPFSTVLRAGSNYDLVDYVSATDDFYTELRQLHE